jgi:release factor glutamine methyltransferase
MRQSPEQPGVEGTPDSPSAAESPAADGTPAPEMPLAYQRGVWPFMGHEFLTAPGTMYPREVSAILVTTLVDLVKSGALVPAPGEPLRVVDQCGGSANVGCVTAMMLPDAHVYSTDLMPVSSALARRNVAKHGLEGRVDVVTGDLFHALDGLGLEGKIDAITCSPPFISTGRLTKDRAYLLAHEPRAAFDAGPYGISMHQRLAKESAPMLRSGGYLILEYGEGQAKQVESIVNRTRAYDRVDVLTDAEGEPRAVRARKA